MRQITKKRIIVITSIVLVVITCFIGYNQLFSKAGNEEQNGKTGRVTWEYSTGTLTLKGEGSMNDYNSKDEVPWNKYCQDIASVKIEDGVTSIGSNAFNGCIELSSVEVPDSVVRIGNQSFWNCKKLTKINIPKNTKCLGYGTFGYCDSLTEFSISEDNNYLILTDGVVYNVGMTKAYCVVQGTSVCTIPASVNKIYKYIFTSDSALSNININSNAKISKYTNEFGNNKVLSDFTVSDDNSTYAVYDGVLYSADFSELYCCPKTKTDITVNEATEVIQDYALYNCKEISAIVLPINIKKVGKECFRGCVNLTTIYVAEKMKTILHMKVHYMIKIKKYFIAVLKERKF